MRLRPINDCLPKEILLAIWYLERHIIDSFYWDYGNWG
jgi:hypothetical protein